jgi:uncharacterized coiled-coil protein SlyX
MNYIIEHWETIALIVTPILAWFAGDKKIFKNKVELSNEEVKSAELNNITVNFKVYQDLITDLENRFKNRIFELEEDLNKMKILNEELRKAIGNQEKYIKKLQNKLEDYEKLER